MPIELTKNGVDSSYLERKNMVKKKLKNNNKTPKKNISFIFTHNES